MVSKGYVTGFSHSQTSNLCAGQTDSPGADSASDGDVTTLGGEYTGTAEARL
jgi:hypothetical protein